MNHVHIVLNQSRIKTYNECHRKYFWEYEEYLTSGAPRPALDIGSAVHKGLETLNAGKSEAEAREAALKKFDELMAEYKVFPDEMQQVLEAKATVERLMDHYFGFWGDFESWTVIKPEVEGMVEVGQVQIDEETTLHAHLRFRTDAVVSWRGHIYLLEHKTMGANHPRNWLKYHRDIQITSYVYALTKFLGIRIQGIIVNGLVKTAIPQFDRQMFNRDDASLQSFEDQFLEIAAEIYLRRRRRLYGEDPKVLFYENTEACYRYGACPFIPLCDKDTAGTRSTFYSRKPDYVDAAALALQQRGPGDGAGPAQGEGVPSREA